MYRVKVRVKSLYLALCTSEAAAVAAVLLVLAEEAAAAGKSLLSYSLESQCDQIHSIKYYVETTGT